MLNENCKIEIEGSEIDEIYDDLISLEVELDEELAGMFRLNVRMQHTDGTWSYLDDERLTIWKRVIISAGYEGDMQQLLKAHITHIRPVFGAGLDVCHLEICGMDASVLMDREEKLK